MKSKNFQFELLKYLNFWIIWAFECVLSCRNMRTYNLTFSIFFELSKLEIFKSSFWRGFELSNHVKFQYKLFYLVCAFQTWIFSVLAFLCDSSFQNMKNLCLSFCIFFDFSMHENSLFVVLKLNHFFNWDHHRCRWVSYFLSSFMSKCKMNDWFLTWYFWSYAKQLGILFLLEIKNTNLKTLTFS